MADILIRKVSEETKARLAATAAARGASLEAFLRSRLEEIAREAPRSNDDDQPFGTWAAALFAESGDGEGLAELIDEMTDRSPAKIPDMFE